MVQPSYVTQYLHVNTTLHYLHNTNTGTCRCRIALEVYEEAYQERLAG